MTQGFIYHKIKEKKSGQLKKIILSYLNYDSCKEFKIQNFTKSYFSLFLVFFFFPVCVWTCKNKICLIYLYFKKILESGNVNLRDWIIITLSPQLTVELRMDLKSYNTT